ncbi:MAG: hypothetical protein JNL90_09545 [Planctomycetes bacterium]|nr:hypothetical protein [Planctomycetota bacterium]
MTNAATITARLAVLRTALRTRWLAAGALRLAVETAGFLVLQYAVDRFLWLPVEARRFVAVAAALLFALRFAQLVVRPLRKRIDARDMALAVERRHPELRGALASMVEVEAAAGPAADVSPTLLAEWRAAVAARAAGVPFDAIFAPQLLRRLAGAAAAALLLIGSFVALRRDESLIFFERLAGADRDWPRRTHLELDVVAATESTHLRVERDADGRATRVLVARGASLPIVVRARGSVPDEVVLIVREEGRSGSEEIRMAPREGGADDFGYRFRNTTRPMELSAAGGDDPGHQIALVVEVAAPPAVERLVATITPPAYTQRPTIREERQDFAVPAGTRLDLEIATSGDVAEAALTLHSDPGTARPLVRDAKTPGLWRGSVIAEESGTLNVHLTAENGFKNLHPIDYPLTVLTDRKPVLELARPAVSDLEATARAVVPFRLLVDDDYGVTEVVLELVRGDDPAKSRVVLQGPGSTRPELLQGVGEPHVLDALLDLATLELPKGEAMRRLAEGESLLYVAHVADNREELQEGVDGAARAAAPAPNVTSSPGRRIDVVSDSEKQRKLNDRQQRVKQTVITAKKAQEERAAGLGALLAALQPASGEGALETRELTALEVEQGRVGGSARQAARDLCEVAAEFALNRLDPTPTAERAVTYLLTELQAADAGPNFDFAPYGKLAAAHAAGEFGVLQQLGNLLAMVDLALQASETHAQRALEQLRGARLAGRPADRLEQLRGAQASQQKVIEVYALLLQKMEEFEDYQEILDLWRGLVDDQQEINRRAREGVAPASSGGGR